MLFIRRKISRIKYNGNNTVYWLLTTVFLSAGMVYGFLDAETEPFFAFTKQSNIASVFMFSFARNFLFIFLIFLNSFSVLGFPLSATVLFACGYFLSDTTMQIYNIESKNSFYLLRVLPYISLQILMYFLIAAQSFKFSKRLFSTVFFKRVKDIDAEKILRLIGALSLSTFCAILSALYESYFL